MGGGFGHDGGVLNDMWVLDVDRGVWSEVSELISLVYDELYHVIHMHVIHMCCCLHVAVFLESLV